MLEWIAFKNPFANGESTYFVADDGGKIVAHLGRMPMEFTIDGQARKGDFTHDLLVHPEYRANIKVEPIMLANLDKCDVAEMLTDINKWHPTYGASDMLMLEVLNDDDLIST